VADQHLYRYTTPHFTYRGQYVQAIVDAPAEGCFCDLNQPSFLKFAQKAEKQLSVIPDRVADRRRSNVLQRQQDGILKIESG
jgi:hypothetical protein